MRVENNRGGLRIGTISEGSGASGGSFTGSGPAGKVLGSLKSSNTVEKTYSDFFNLT